MFVQAGALVVVIQACVFCMHVRAIHRHTRLSVTYAPMFVCDRERMNNLNYIYNNSDVESVNMPRMKKLLSTNL
jgi:hypothetical protein